jgi:hypothetical protein
MGGVIGARGARALATVAIGVVCGCRGGDGQGPYAREMAKAIPRIEAATGLKFKTPPRLEVRSREQVRQFLVKKFEEETPAQELAGEEAAYKVLGLLPDSMDLRKFLLAVLHEQVVGYYDPATKVLYVVEGADEQTVGITVTHELVHALQDQYVNLDSIQKSIDDNDRLTAAQAVIEGQAQFEQLSIMLGGSDNVALRVGGRDQIREMIRENQSAMPVFATAPMMVQESLLFPYLSGADYVQRFKERRGMASPLTDLPRSTEQVLHTPAFFGTTVDEPSVISLPAPRGATKTYENSLGEFGTRLFLYQHLRDERDAARGGSGWDGDRYVVLQGAGGRGIVWASLWDTALEAAEFSDMVTRATAKRTGAGEASVAGGARFSTKGRTTTIVARAVGDRTLIVYSDLPDAMSGGVIDAAAIKVTTR